ncbi:MAG: hypothetical protein EHM28_14555 [Spirochaetaceae bacterium]|nr:MAG: hypothetical protein EHM28_14555 [Spirochaetaceae bacterium]
MRKELDPIIARMREIFDKNFDRAWFFSVLESVPLQMKSIREIREFLRSEKHQQYDTAELEEKAQEIEAFLRVIREYLLPELRERLGISYLDPQNLVDDKDELLTRKFIAYTLPHNLKEFLKLNEEFKRELAEKGSGSNTDVPAENKKPEMQKPEAGKPADSQNLN